MPEDQDADRTRIARQFIAAIPHCRALGMQLVDMWVGWATRVMDYDESFVGDPDTGVLHGGVVTTLLDTCAGTSVMAHPSAPTGTATLDLRIDYMRAAPPGRRLFARADCYRVTRSVGFVRGFAWTESIDDPVAMASGAFTLERAG